MQYLIENGSADIDSEQVTVSLTGAFKRPPAVSIIGDYNSNIFISDVTEAEFKVNVSSYTIPFTVKYHAIERS